MDKSLDNLNVRKFAFLKSQRLLKAGDFQQVFAAVSEGKLSTSGAGSRFQFKVHQANFLLFVKVQTGEHKISRLGLAITKKKVKRAHERNRIKRLTREYFRLNQAQLVRPVDMVLTVKVSPEPLENAQIVTQLQGAFNLINQKLKALPKDSPV